jgi:uncharacterized protein with PIN domain
MDERSKLLAHMEAHTTYTKKCIECKSPLRRLANGKEKFSSLGDTVYIVRNYVCDNCSATYKELWPDDQ